MQSAFDEIDGVVETAVGYTGGHSENPTYKQVCGGDTGHAEAVEVSFDPAQRSYEHLLDAFWAMHDPTTLNRQGPDTGRQYRSAVFYANAEQKRVAEAVSELPERQKAALALCHYEGLSNIEAAAILDMSVGAVESLLVRARRNLRDSLADLAGATGEK